MILIQRYDLRELSSAKWTGGMTAQPRVDALRVEAVAALCQLPVTMAAADIREANGAKRQNSAVLLINRCGRKPVSAVEFVEEGGRVGGLKLMIHAF